MRVTSTDFINTFRQSQVKKVESTKLDNGQFVAHFREPFFLGKVISEDEVNYTIEIIFCTDPNQIGDEFGDDYLDRMWILDPKRFSMIQKSQINS